MYANTFHTGYWNDLNRPEQWGFLPNQVQPFNFTSGNETLYAWHILPLGAYRKHEKRILASPVGIAADSSQSTALDILKNDPNKRLVIKFHGNAGTVAQGWRPETYRMLVGADPNTIHVLAFDYRGFGYSTGLPSEYGLIQDGIAAVDWALHVAGISPGRIVLYGQSLGTAVATSVAEHFAVKRQIGFAGLVLVAPFSSIPDLLPRYFIAGFIPTLSPLRTYPRILTWVLSQVVDRWNTSARLANLVEHSEFLNVALIHARNDAEIPSTHSEILFLTAANATVKDGMNHQTISDVKQHEEIIGGGWTDTWIAEGENHMIKRIKLVMFPGGGMFPSFTLSGANILKGTIKL